jgi:hypothetical protein
LLFTRHAVLFVSLHSKICTPQWGVLSWVLGFLGFGVPGDVSTIEC